MSRDELGELAEAFNAMLEQIQRQNDALVGARGALQERMQERTEQLARESSGKREAQEALRSKEEQLRQSMKMEAIGRLAGGVAHDFNNLLTVINGLSELMIESLRPGDPLVEDLTEIKHAGERASGLTRQLLAFSRNQMLVPRVLDLNQSLADMEKMLKRVIGEDILLETVFHPGPAWVKVDPGQMEQVILNLVVNSRDAMPDGGALRIEVAQGAGPTPDSLDMATQPGPWVKLSVSDTGCGMSPDTRSKLFDPFFTTKKMGTGLGLSTAYGIVKQTGGDISVSSQPRQGSTFRVYLPRVDAPSDQVGPALESQEPAKRGTETILVVEDEAAVRKLVHRTLEADGYTVLEALDEGDALLICERHPGTIHLLLTDVIMPTITGPEVYRRVAELRPDIHVLFMSGYTDHAVLHDEAAHIRTAFIQKPFKPKVLLMEVRRVLDGDR